MQILLGKEPICQKKNQTKHPSWVMLKSKNLCQCQYEHYS